MLIVLHLTPKKCINKLRELLVQLKPKVGRKSRPFNVMKKNLNDQVTLVVTNVKGITVWNRELPSAFKEGETVLRKEVELHLDEVLEANNEKGEMSSVGVLWVDLKKSIRQLPCGDVYFSLLPKWEPDILDQEVKDEEKAKPDDAFANHIYPLFKGAKVVLLQSKTLVEATDENGATAEVAQYIRGLATDKLAEKLGVAEQLKKELKALKMDVVELAPLFKIKGAREKLLQLRREQQLRDKKEAEELGIEFVPKEYYAEQLEKLRQKEVELSVDKMLDGIL